MDAYIEFRNVVKKFDDFVALDHVSLQIPKGAFVTLLGPSGCGKTTLMRQLAGFSEPEEGDVLVDGKRMNGLPPFKRNTPLVFQEYALFPHMTVYENISYGLKLKKAPKEEKDRKVAEMLEMFNLQGLDGRFPKQLSGGQQQRVAFARALVMGQEILLLDEPLSNLDAKLRVEVRTELRQIQQKFGITTMYVTHDQDEALSMSDIIAVMRRGRIERHGELPGGYGPSGGRRQPVRGPQGYAPPGGRGHGPSGRRAGDSGGPPGGYQPDGAGRDCPGGHGAARHH